MERHGQCPAVAIATVCLSLEGNLSVAQFPERRYPDELCRTCATSGRTDQLRRAPLLLEENDTTQSPAMKTT